jgi:CRP-like cAMP-binding protein
VSTTPHIARALREIRLLGEFSDAELDELGSLGEPRHFEAHANVVIEGEPSWGLYVILDGTLGVFKANPISGDAHDVAQLSSGNFFGEMSLVDDHPRSASVRALSPASLFYIGKNEFHAWLRRKPERLLRFYEECVKHLVARLRETDENYAISKYQLWRTALRPSGALPPETVAPAATIASNRKPSAKEEAA